MKGLCAFVLATFSLVSASDVFAQEKSERDTVMKTDLQEIVVKAKNIRHEGMKDILYLGRDNRNLGSNALDAIS